MHTTNNTCDSINLSIIQLTLKKGHGPGRSSLRMILHTTTYKHDAAQRNIVRHRSIQRDEDAGATRRDATRRDATRRVAMRRGAVRRGTARLGAARRDTALPT